MAYGLKVSSCHPLILQISENVWNNDFRNNNPKEFKKNQNNDLSG